MSYLLKLKASLKGKHKTDLKVAVDAHLTSFEVKDVNQTMIANDYDEFAESAKTLDKKKKLTQAVFDIVNQSPLGDFEVKSAPGVRKRTE